MTIIDVVIANHDAAGRPADCAIRIWAAQQKPMLDAITNPAAKAAKETQLRAKLLAHPDWKPQWSAQGILAVSGYPEGKKASVQGLYARHIMDAEGPEIRFIINDLLQRENKTPGTLAPGVAKLMQVWIEKNGQGLRGLARARKKTLVFEES